MTQQTNQHMDQQINPSQQDNKKQISFELIQAQETGMLFSPDFLLDHFAWPNDGNTCIV